MKTKYIKPENLMTGVSFVERDQDTKIIVGNGVVVGSSEAKIENTKIYNESFQIELGSIDGEVYINASRFKRGRGFDHLDSALEFVNSKDGHEAVEICKSNDNDSVPFIINEKAQVFMRRDLFYRFFVYELENIGWKIEGALSDYDGQFTECPF